LIKGVLHPEDAAKARSAGVDGLIVSNHGGRQLDGAISAISALNGVLRAVDGRIPVFADSGFRSGLDIAKALAMGAKGVFVGRPLLYGLATGGEQGAASVLELLGTELERAMTLAGAPDVAALSREILRTDVIQLD
jgi:(S)-mandelate dehydrogenase